MTLTFTSQRHPAAAEFVDDEQSPHWSAVTPFGPATLHTARHPARTVLVSQGLPGAALHERDGGYTPTRRGPLLLEVGNESGEVDAPYNRLLLPQLSRSSRTVRVQLPSGVWFLRAAGVRSVQLERDGVTLARSNAAFTEHELTDTCTPQDLAVHLALSPLRLYLFVLINTV